MASSLRAQATCRGAARPPRRRECSPGLQHVVSAPIKPAEPAAKSSEGRQPLEKTATAQWKPAKRATHCVQAVQGSAARSAGSGFALHSFDGLPPIAIPRRLLRGLQAQSQAVSLTKASSPHAPISTPSRYPQSFSGNSRSAHWNPSSLPLFHTHGHRCRPRTMPTRVHRCQ